MIESREVGRVVGVFRYPVKSMAACALDVVEVSWNGLDGDRRWAFIREGQSRSGFPWLTLRERADMNHYQPSFVEPQRPDASATVVRTPSGRVLDVTDPELAIELGEGARVMKQDRGVFDTMPISLISRQTLESLGAAVGATLDVHRFRPNLVVDAPGEDPYPEDAWVGQTIRVGSARVRIDKRDGRCVVVTIDPTTGTRTPDVLRAIARDRRGMLGVYGSTVEPGRIRLGDPVSLEP